MAIELRSDTFTKPTPGMLEAMFSAPVGDDVFGEDPSVNQLEKLLADMFGMEAGLFCPSGTMTNQIAIKAHTQPGDEVICDEQSHVYQYEGGGIAFNSGASVKLLQGDRGRITANLVSAAIHPDDVHRAKSSLVVLENSSNRGGGSCYDFREIEAIGDVCRQHSMHFHLDGARLWNALITKGETTLQYGKAFDSISLCLSKGLGTPVGSVLIGNESFIKKSRRIRKVFGGGMRQAGYLAAAGIYAVKNHIERLKEDHANAAMTAAVLAEMPWVKEILPVETNILIFSTTSEMPPKKLVALLAEKGVLCLPTGPQTIRFVFHLDVSKEETETLCAVIKSIRI